MKPNEIRAIARERNIPPQRLPLTELVRTMQRQEGNSDCFGTDLAARCDQDGCLWRANCLAPQEAA